jgi:hypothetical protein
MIYFFKKKKKKKEMSMNDRVGEDLLLFEAKLFITDSRGSALSAPNPSTYSATLETGIFG